MIFMSDIRFNSAIPKHYSLTETLNTFIASLSRRMVTATPHYGCMRAWYSSCYALRKSIARIIITAQAEEMPTQLNANFLMSNGVNIWRPIGKHGSPCWVNGKLGTQMTRNKVREISLTVSPWMAPSWCEGTVRYSQQPVNGRGMHTMTC